MPADKIEVATSVPFDFWSAVIASIFGFVTGAIASLVSPWVHWFIEKRRKSIEHKVYLISELRKMIDTSETLQDMKTSSYWGIIEANLNDKEKELIRHRTGQLHYTIGEPELTKDQRNKNIISSVIARIEKNWGLST